MANRIFHNPQSIERGVVSVFLGVDIGAAGAPTAKKLHGVASITRTGAGTYDIVLSDAYAEFLGSEMTLVGVAADLTYQFTAMDVANKTMTLVTKAGAVATDPANGDEIYLELKLKNTSVAY